MSRKLVFAMTLTLFLVGVFGMAFQVQRVKASGTIYIRSTGNVEGTDKIQRNGDIYTLTGNIFDRIVVEKSNIVIDGNRFTIQGNGSGNGFLLWSIHNTTIKNVNIKRFEVGIYLGSASENVVSQNNITRNYYGMTVWSAFNNSIVGNNISSNDYIGINVYGDSNHNTISGNNMRDNVYVAIAAFGGSSNNDIIGNNIVNSTYGIHYGSSNYNTIIGNNITKNSYGIELYNSTHNSFHHNMFVNNTVQVVCRENSTNIWDKGSEGNYWSNYTRVDLDHDGIGDTAHAIDANNTDNYPLMGMFSSFNISLDYNVNAISNSTIEDFDYFDSNSTLRMHVSNMTENQTYGFCRLCIPKDLIAPPYSVTINNGAIGTLHFNDTIHDNETHRWIYFAYEHSTLEIVIVPEFPSLVILPLFMIATLLAVIVYRRKHSM